MSIKHRIACLCALAWYQLALAQTPKEADWPDAASEWFYHQRTYPAGIPLGARVKALADIRRLDLAARTKGNAATADAANWTFIGPKPTADLAPKQVFSGRVAAIVVDPRDSNTIYLGSASGGVWKTTDAGSNWTPLGDGQPTLSIGSIALDPKNPDIVYVGTGEQNFSGDNYYGAGILKSTNGGSSWTSIQGPFLHAYIGGITVSPANSQVILCSVGNLYSLNTTGIWRSIDAGANWTRVLNGVATSVMFDPSNGNIAYAGLGDSRGASANGAYRSTDGGQTWNAIRGSGANVLPNQNAGRIALAIASSTPSTLYAAVEDVRDAGLLDVYKSTDSGGTWNATKAPEICPSGQCFYDIAIAVHPKDSNVVYTAGDHALARTLDGGSTWGTFIDGDNFAGPNGVGIHVDEHVLTFTPDGSKLYLGNDGGIFSTSDVMASQTRQVNWTELNDTLALTQFYPGIAIHPSNVNRALGGTQDNRTQLYTGSLGWQSVTCGDGGSAAFDFSLPSVAFAICTSKDATTLLRSTDSGNNWLRSEYGINRDDRAAFIPPFAMDPSNPKTVYYGTYRLWQSRDSGGKFTTISGDLTSGGIDTITSIAVAPTDSRTVYISAASATPSLPAAVTSARVQVTNNALDANPVWNDRSAGLPRRVATRILVDPIDPLTVYVTFSGFSSGSDTQGHVFKTSNAGANWSDISGNLPNLPVNDIVLDPDVLNTIYIATDLGVMVSRDGGSSWSSLGGGLPNVVVHSVVLHRPSRILRAGTYGRGAWDIAVPLPSRSLQPTLTSLNPASATVNGGAFNLQVTGTNLVAGVTLRWNGSNRPTTVIDSSHLTASINAADIAQIGRAAIDVFNPSRAAGFSNSLSFPIGLARRVRRRHLLTPPFRRAEALWRRSVLLRYTARISRESP